MNSPPGDACIVVHLTIKQIPITTADIHSASERYSFSAHEAESGQRHPDSIRTHSSRNV